MTSASDSDLVPLWKCWNPLLSAGQGWSEQRLRWTLFAPFGLCMAPAYYCVVHLMSAWGRVAWDPTLAIDLYIPAVPLAICPYFTHFLYYPGLVVGTPPGPRSTRALLGLIQAMVVVAVLSFAVFIVLPAKVDLRAQMLEALVHEGAMVKMLYTQLYRTDPPFNAWPSLHISHTLLVALYLNHHWTKVWARRLLWFFWASLAVSVVLTKQHLAFDVLTGAVLGWASWFWLARPHAAPQEVNPKSNS